MPALWIPISVLAARCVFQPVLKAVLKEKRRISSPPTMIIAKVAAFAL
jgi:hypothetical protein